MRDLERESYIDTALATGEKGGYRFQYSARGDKWQCQANPEISDEGWGYFFVDETGVIRRDRERTATAADRPID